mgnify:CR=1 FL=1
MPKDEKQVNLVNKVRNCLKRARQYQDRWRKEAEESTNFVAGHQWDDADEGVPAASNYVQPYCSDA